MRTNLGPAPGALEDGKGVSWLIPSPQRLERVLCVAPPVGRRSATEPEANRNRSCAERTLIFSADDFHRAHKGRCPLELLGGQQTEGISHQDVDADIVGVFQASQEDRESS